MNNKKKGADQILPLNIEIELKDKDNVIHEKNITQNSNESENRKNEHRPSEEQEDDDEDQEQDNEIKIPKQPEIREKMLQFQKYMIAKDYQSAEQEISAMIQIQKGDASLYYLRAEVYMKQNKYIQSLQDMNQAIKYEPVKQCAKSSQYHYEIKKTLMQMSNDI